MIIGIDGYVDAGKDTVADIFVRLGFTKISFADALRESVVYATGFTLDTFIDRDLKDRPFDEPYLLSSEVLTKFCSYTGFSSKAQQVIDQFIDTPLSSPRDILVFLGTEIGRIALSNTIWIDKYDEKRQGLANVVTPDCRFSEEKTHIKNLDGKMFWVYRDGISPKSDHISENDKWPFEQYDVTVHNTEINILRSELGLWWSMKGSKIR
jgi:hypothetical protein